MAASGYEFGPYRLEVPTRRLLRGTELVPLTPKAFDILVALIERRDRVVDKAELMKIVWPDSFVEEANLSQTIFVLRKTLGDTADGSQYIETVPRRGYRFTTEVRVAAADKEAEILPRSPASIRRSSIVWLAIAAAVVVLPAVVWQGRATSDAPIRSIAVLPLANLSGQSGEQYLADGLTDALLSDLAQIEALRVVARTSTLRYRDTYTLLVGFIHAAPRVAIPKAEAAAMKALELNPDLGDAYVSLGYIRFRYDYDWPRGEDAFKRAIALNPSSELAHHWYALSLGWADRPADARVEIERALKLDPLSTATLTSSGFIHYSAREYDQAIAVFDRVLAIEPNNIVAFRRRGWAYQMLGRHAEAIASFERASALSGRDFIELASLGRGYARAGQPAEARQVIDEMRKRDPGGDLTAYSIAEVFAALGEANNALMWLDRAHTARSIWFIFLKTEPLFDGLRNDPRFQQLVDRVKW